MFPFLGLTFFLLPYNTFTYLSAEQDFGLCDKQSTISTAMKLKASRPTLHNDVRFLFVVCLINLQGTNKYKIKYSLK